MKRSPNFIDLKGKKFGRLIVIKLYKTLPTTKWECKCNCGNIKIVDCWNLRSGHTKSCGCLHNEMLRKYKYKHGMSKTIFGKIFYRINNRVNNQKSKDYKNYGGRGIKLLWESFEEFKKDMYRSYLSHVKKYGEKQTSIDRINNDGDYCKENCRWATSKEQNNNKRNIRIIIYEGKTYTLSGLSKKFNLKHSVLYNRLFRYNYPLEKALE